MRRQSGDGDSPQQWVPLHDLTAPMRWYVIVVWLLAAVGLACAAWAIGPAEIGRALSDPRLWLMLGLIAVADLYPLTPWMRDVRGRIRIHWSGAFTLAAMLVAGPAVVVLFPLIALGAASTLRSVWWRRAFNVAVLTLEGLAGVLVLELAFGPWPVAPGAPELLAAGTAIAVAWEIVNVGFVCTALVLLGGIRWRASLRIGWRRTGPWLAALLTSPMIAYLAITAPFLVAGLAVVTAVVHHSIAGLIRKSDEARTDQLTGLANRTAALELLETCLSADPRRADPVMLIMVDLDGFKAINDTFGHDAGDRVLADVGARIRRTVPQELMVARLGGDEFVVVGLHPQDPESLARAIRTEIRQPLAWQGRVMHLDCSAGWIRARPGVAAMDALRAADRQLYRSKRSRPGGDNASPTPPPVTLAPQAATASAPEPGRAGSAAAPRAAG